MWIGNIAHNGILGKGKRDIGNVEVREPQIIKSKRLLDFGTGFYLTSDFEKVATAISLALDGGLR